MEMLGFKTKCAEWGYDWAEKWCYLRFTKKTAKCCGYRFNVPALNDWARAVAECLEEYEYYYNMAVAEKSQVNALYYYNMILDCRASLRYIKKGQLDTIAD